jgi:xylan 1,4-beta-xylosidase
VQVTLRGVKPGAYTLAISQAGYRRNDAFTAWIGMGSPAQLTRQQVSELKAQATGAPSERRTVWVGADGKVSLTLPLRENDVYLLKLSSAPGKPAR